ncbi:ABC transporter permease [Staphylococcus simulans]|uniref:ABC transporter permease n=1 Tax=Staphylococcus simulans TaxID=1286 RepID=UPI00399AE2AF
MNKFLATFNLTYKNKVKSRAFIIMTVILAVIIIAAANLNKIIDLFDNGPDKIGIASNEPHIAQMVKAQSKHIEDKGTEFKILSKENALKEVKNEKLDKAYIIELSGQQIKGEVVGKDAPSDESVQKLESILTPIQTQAVAQQMNLSSKELSDLQQKSKVTSKAIGKNGAETTKSNKFLNWIILYAGIMLMFIVIMNYANQVAMEVATEKTSRVIEMVITSISPVKHILAKIAAMICVAFTQVLILVIIGAAALYFSDAKDLMKQFDMTMTPTTTRLIIVGVLSIIIGVVSYTVLGTILGTLTTRIEDLNQAVMPMTVISLIAFYIALFSMNNPDMPFTKIASFIPLLSPYLLFVRASTPNIESWEIIVSMALSVAFLVLLVWVAVKSYRDSVLTFDKNIFRALKRALKK